LNKRVIIIHGYKHGFKMDHHHYNCKKWNLNMEDRKFAFHIGFLPWEQGSNVNNHHGHYHPFTTVNNGSVVTSLFTNDEINSTIGKDNNKNNCICNMKEFCMHNYRTICCQRSWIIVVGERIKCFIPIAWRFAMHFFLLL